MEKTIQFQDYAVNEHAAYTLGRAIAAAKASGATLKDRDEAMTLLEDLKQIGGNQ